MGFASLKLAEKLQEDGALEQVICMGLDRDADVFGDRAQVFRRNRVLGFAYWIVAKLGLVFSFFKPRKFHEFLFDRFARSRLKCQTDTLLFVSRPLFNRTIHKAKSNGMKVWVQSSVAHPLLNFGLVRNEEMRLGLASKGPYSDIGWTITITQAILQADRLITLDPSIGKFTFDSYRDFIDPRKMLPLKEYFSIDPGEFAEISHGRQPKGPNDEIVFFHLSHINLIKGVPYLLEAWRTLQERGTPNCRLVLGGRIDHNISQLIRDQFHDLKNVEYTGFIPELADVLSQVDVFISPSISDAGPATLLEAMASGIPVVTSNNCGFSSLVTNCEQGFKYNYNDVDRLTEILGWCSDHRTEIYRMGMGARKKMESLSLNQYAAELVGHIEDLGGDGDIQ